MCGWVQTIYQDCDLLQGNTREGLTKVLVGLTWQQLIHHFTAHKSDITRTDHTYLALSPSNTERYCIWFTSCFKCTHLVMHLASPHLLHSAKQSHESVKSVTDKLVSAALKVCQNSYSTIQVCMSVCASGVRVVMHVCRWASWCFSRPLGIALTSVR